MCRLTEKQLEIVTNDVDNEGINFSHLKYDLIDHICCTVESYLNQGVSFTQAYDLVKKEFNIRGLRQIQQDTLMLIDKNYRIMKKSMKMIGVLAMALMAFGALFKIGHWPGASIMLTLSFFFTALVFFPTLLYVIYKEVNQKKQVAIFIIAFNSGALFMSGVLFKIMHWPEGSLLFFLGLGLISYILIPLIIALRSQLSAVNKQTFLIGLVSLMVFLTGMIFKIQHWPGARIILALGSIMLVLIFVPMYYVFEVKNSEKFRIDFIFGTIALVFFIVMSFLLNFSGNSSQFIDVQQQEKSFIKNAHFLNQQNEELEKKIENAAITKLTTSADKLNVQLNNLKVLILQHNMHCSKEEATKALDADIPVQAYDNTVNFLLENGSTNSQLKSLKTQIDSFKTYYNEIVLDSLKTESGIDLLFSSVPKLNDEHLLPNWEEYQFSNTPSAIALNKLSFWQYGVRLAENRALYALTTKLKN